MALVFKVGDDNQMPPVPKDFPKCGDYIPSASNEDFSESTVWELNISLGAIPYISYLFNVLMVIILLLI